MAGRAPVALDAPRVVVTGVGSVSALGLGGGEVLSCTLARGKPGIRPIQGFSTTGCPSQLGGEVGELSEHLTTNERRRLARVSQLTTVACRLAAADAGLDPARYPGLGLVLGSQYGDFRSSEEFARGFLARGPLGLSPVLFPNTVMNAMGAQAAIALGARGPMLTINQHGIAGELAIARGTSLIATGRAPAVLAGGVDELCPVLYQELARLGTLSPRGGGPEGCWPFDRRANGTVIGEGATVLLLEAEDRARARGARVYAAVRGVAWGNLAAQAGGFPAARGRDPVVVRRALAAAGVGPADVDALYLTGAGYPAQDACELDLVVRTFGRPDATARPRLTALTPLAGDHAGLGALRVAAAAVATVTGGRLPVLPDLRMPVTDARRFSTTETAELDARVALVHGLARGGGHAAIVLGRPAPAGAAGV